MPEYERIRVIEKQYFHLFYTVEDNDMVIPMYNLIQYSDVYSKTPGHLWQYYIDKI